MKTDAYHVLEYNEMGSLSPCLYICDAYSPPKRARSGEGREEKVQYTHKMAAAAAEQLSTYIQGRYRLRA
jgi:hypothetical protein